MAFLKWKYIELLLLLLKCYLSEKFGRRMAPPACQWHFLQDKTESHNLWMFLEKTLVDT